MATMTEMPSAAGPSRTRSRRASIDDGTRTPESDEDEWERSLRAELRENQAERLADLERQVQEEYERDLGVLNEHTERGLVLPKHDAEQFRAKLQIRFDARRRRIRRPLEEAEQVLAGKRGIKKLSLGAVNFLGLRNSSLRRERSC